MKKISPTLVAAAMRRASSTISVRRNLKPWSPQKGGCVFLGENIVRHNCSAVDVRIVVQNDVQQ
jgi:hypothetical protein